MPRSSNRADLTSADASALAHLNAASGVEAAADAVPPGEWVAAQVDALAAAWKRGEPASVSAILAAHPEIDAEDAVRLIYEEVCLRRESGHEVATSEVVRRFPRWQAELEMLLGCDRLMRPPLVEFPHVGEHLGEFQLLDELGRGRSGRTYLAAQPLLADRPVVLKVTTLDHDEHLSLARLQHTHIVPLYSEQLFSDRGLRALCMPYLGGKSLAQILSLLADIPAERRTGRDLLEALDRARPETPGITSAGSPFRSFLEQASYVQAICWMAACLADALHYAHERGLVHMDVKPSNVLISSDGQPMLLDFHLARAPLRPGGEPPDRLGGTPGWMAPEQERAMRAVAAERAVAEPVDGRADLFSLGLLLYEALGGTPGTAELTDRCNLSACNAAVSVGLADMVHACLAAEPALRYQNAASLADDLRRHLNDQPLLGVANRSWLERWRKWRRRQPHALFYGAARLAIVAATITVAVLLVAHYRQRVAQLNDALADAVRLERAGQFNEAARTAARGLALARRTFAAGGLKPALEAQLALARRGNKAEELHRLADIIRFHDGIAPSSADEMRSLAEQCQRVWQERESIMNRTSALLSPEAERRIIQDLREIALIWADLRVRLADASETAQAHREALHVLDRAAVSLGRSPALVRERAAHARAIGLAGERNAADLAPTTPWEHYDLGRSLLRSGQLEEAASQFRLALEDRPQDFWPNYSQGLCAYRLGQFGEALGAFRACVTLAPDRPECYYNRALAYEALGQPEAARHDYSKAIQLDPGLPGAFLNRGILSYKAKHPREAIADFEQALACPRGRALAGTVHYNLALAHLLLGNRSAALTETEKATAAGSIDARDLAASLRDGR